MSKAEKPEPLSAGELAGLLTNHLSGVLFQSNGEGYISIHSNEKLENYRVRSRSVKALLVHQCMKDKDDKVPSSETLESAIRILEAQALFGEKSRDYTLHNRVAWSQDIRGNRSLLYDLGNGRAIQVTAVGWSPVVPSILFRRYPHQSTAVIPEPSDEPIKDRLEKLWKLENVQEETKHLQIIQHVASFLPIPQPIAVFVGEQGCGKTWVVAVWKWLVDPSKLKTLSMPKDTDQLIQTLDHHWFVPLDNLSYLSPEQSDVLCRAVSGDGQAKRVLYSDDEDFIRNYQRSIALTGVNNIAERPDLKDRCILYTLPAIPTEDRLTEEQLKENFAKLAPSIQGAIFDAISKAIKLKPTIELNGLHRMSDFCEWGAAIAAAIGYDVDKEFLEEYEYSLEALNTETLEEDAVGAAVRKLWQDEVLLNDNDKYEADPKTAYNAISGFAEQLGFNTKAKRWPKNPGAMSRRLNVVKTDLRKQGILFCIDRSGKERQWKLTGCPNSGNRVTRVIASQQAQKASNSQSSSDETLDDVDNENNVVTSESPKNGTEGGNDAMTTMTRLPELSSAERLKEASSNQIVCDSIENILQYVKPNSVDLILTDPPYTSEGVPLWAVLSEKAATILKPGSLLVCYAGQYHLPKLMQHLSKCLQYVWTMSVQYTGPSHTIKQRNIENEWMPVLIYAKPPYSAQQERITDVVFGTGREKDDHEWQKPLGECEELVERFSRKGDLIVDPFLGSGTVAVAAKNKGRRFFGLDVDEKAIKTTLSRLAKEAV